MLGNLFNQCSTIMLLAGRTRRCSIARSGSAPRGDYIRGTVQSVHATCTQATPQVQAHRTRRRTGTTLNYFVAIELNLLKKGLLWTETGMLIRKT